MARDRLSHDSLISASADRAEFSGHGRAKGAAGVRAQNDGTDCAYLSKPGLGLSVNPHKDAFGTIHIGAQWDNVRVQKATFFKKLWKKLRRKGVDIDLGCLYELDDGRRGAIQAFGDMFGKLEDTPFIHLLGDERTGDKHGDDETILVNGQSWDRIKKILIYIYIYDGAEDWSTIRPQIKISIPDEQPMIVTLDHYRNDLPLCALATLENVRGGIKLTNHTEYFPGHAEMDRAFGFGLNWGDGRK